MSVSIGLPQAAANIVAAKKHCMATLLPETWGHFIDGVYLKPQGGGQNSIEVVDPARDQILGVIPSGDADTVQQAVEAGQKAMLGSWGSSTMEARAKVVRKMADLILEHQDEFATLESLDTGKPIQETHSGDVVRASRNLRVFSELASHSSGRVFRGDDGAEHMTIREPLGVVGLITPWNLPLHLATWKIAPALMQGNTVILKPAEWTPLSAMALGQIANRAGLPPGVLNIVHGYGPQSAGEALVRHPDIKAISFTGESSTGSAIMAAGAGSLKKLSFELGGKGASLVFEDADLEWAATTCCRAAFRNQGQVCLAGSRIIVEETVAERFLELLQKAAAKIVVGDPLDPRTTMGSLVHRQHRDRVADFVAGALREPGVLRLTGGGIPFEGGAFYAPTILTGVRQEQRIIQEEVFGPVVTVQTFKGFEEALALVNGTRFGLSCSIFTRDLAKAQKASRQARMGLVWINDWFLRDLHTAFGGMKHSGLGREGGEYSLDFYSEIKTISYGALR